MNAERTVSARWTLCEHWWVHSEREQREVESASERTMSARKMGKLNFLYLYHGSIGQYHFNNETSFLLPRWIMGLGKWWYWQTFKFKRQLMSLCMLKYHRSQQYCKVAAKNNLHTIAYTFLRIYALLLHTCDTTSFEFPR